MTPSPWRQVHVTFPDWATAEHDAVAHLGPLLATAEVEGLVESWFFIRKSPSWRLRYQPASASPDADAATERLVTLGSAHDLDITAGIVYEPETHAFGGHKAMAGAHRLFHRDSHHLLSHLALPPNGTSSHRRELSILLCTALLRAAGLDWYEQGDVWARVADHRDRPDHIPPDGLPALQNSLQRLMSANVTHLTSNGGSLAFAADWTRAYTGAGQELAALAATGQLHRGLRAVLAHHIIFAWNRHGLPHTTQGALAHVAKSVVFGTDPAASSEPPQGGEPCTTPARR
ncbi:thiopeptide-type bacteriocin biosynthesis domain-containing protein [Actinacidiphila yanglinensis]|uniref:Thiopeptide-type bacteriocin biosynthesis domain-containing protein n=1 Tax=Actinacidiphila yanglinensis TaxID=310779 RepID=A0A1H6ECZ2_9ACTN|nr:thiopeptide-type bacteriocin biosynthesis protein [Actinacidiphila yanglinensis]SEG94754.1 thiopeptide-type bacteriocin biosynthesis domain-containing protein [Actinacidiphila yanglinensis]